MMDEQIGDIVLILERSAPQEKRDMVYAFMERLCLYARAIARDAQASGVQLTQMQGAIEIFERCLIKDGIILRGPVWSSGWCIC